ncbi:hypothetical protein ACT4S5_18425 [Kocuria oceani]|uniref:hypothetical protein n=1 Tax=Kocuria oceani TaxID=988827 RepID=UPI004036B7FA
MTVYRIRLTDGTTHTLNASRMVAGHEELLFQSSRTDGWHTTQSWQRHRVEAVRRRITEVNGSWQWIPVRLDDIG